MVTPDPPTPAPVSADELAALMTLLREVSDDLHTTAQTVATLQQAPAWVTTLEQRLTALGTPGWPPRPPAGPARWWGGGLLCLGLLAGSLGGWWGRGHYGSEQREVRLLGRLDPLLTQSYPTLSQRFRTKLDAVYTQAGFLAPGKRYGGGREEPGR